MKESDKLKASKAACLRRAVDQCFLAHPRSAGESYGVHLAFTLRAGFYLIVTALCIVIHGLVPRFFQTTGSDRIRRLHQDLCDRAMKARCPDDPA